MPENHLLTALALIVGVSVFAVCILRRLGIPSVVAYLLCGIALGPHTLGAVTDDASLHSIAEIGLIFLLFSAGMHFSLRELKALKRVVVGAGGGQVLICSLAGLAGCLTLGMAAPQAALVGCALALSSTAVVAKLLEERGEMETSHGRAAMGVLLAQDLAVVPLLVLTSSLGGEARSGWASAGAIALPIVLLCGVMLVAGWAAPRLLRRAVATRSREVLNLSIVGIAVGSAAITGKIGVPIELGAFLAGIIVSESEYADHVLGELAPLRDVFAALFFVSIGLMVDPHLWLERPGAVLLGVSAVAIGKAAVVAVLAIAFGFGARAAIIAGVAVGQVGEFSYVLAGVGLQKGLLEREAYRMLISVTALTMAATPILLPLASRLTRRLDEARLPRWLGGRSTPDEMGDQVPPGDHVILIGYGPAGRRIARALGSVGRHVVALEMNPATVETARVRGRDVHYADAGRLEALERAGLATAAAVVVSTTEPTAGRIVTELAKRVRPDLPVIVRTRFAAEVAVLRSLGADAVAAEDEESAITVAEMLLHALGSGEEPIAEVRRAMREHGYAALLEEPVAEARRSMRSRGYATPREEPEAAARGGLPE